MTYDIEQRTVTVWSEGSRLAAALLRPVGAEDPRPAILFCHGWGGLKEHLIDLYAKTFAAAGYVSMVFDYTGWGQSDGRLIPANGTPMLTEAGPQRVEVRVIREVVDPLDQIADVRACFAYLLAEEGVDPNRVGAFGTSYGAGHVVSVAGTDPRVKVVVAQIGGYGHPREDWYRELAHQRMADKARGVLEPPIPQGVDGSPTLRGTPDIARQYGHAPLAHAAGIRVPTLFIDAENEEYNEPALQGGAAHEVVRQHATSERRTFPCTHYALYDEHLPAARQLALDWFAEHL